MLPILVCPDSFKGTLRASEVAGAIGRGIERAGLVPPDLCPVADGGEGTMEVLLTRLGGTTGAATVTGPLGERHRTGFGLIEAGGTAIVEVAAASGLSLVGRPSAQTAVEATSYGTGELIMAAAATGAEVILLAAGGSATTDGGAGAIEAIEAQGGLQGAKLVVLCDVQTPYELAPETFGPQKGAGPEEIVALTATITGNVARLPKDPRGLPMTGAAGGLAGGLWAQYEAQLIPGARFVLEALDFDERMRASRCVITGEGRLDQTTLEGKICGEIATRARQAGVPAHAICGRLALDRFSQRILDLQVLLEAGTIAELEAAGESLARRIREGSA